MKIVNLCSMCLVRNFSFARIAKLTFDDAVAYLKGTYEEQNTTSDETEGYSKRVPANKRGHVAIFDATNTTTRRRKLLLRWCFEADVRRVLSRDVSFINTYIHR